MDSLIKLNIKGNENEKFSLCNYCWFTTKLGHSRRPFWGAMKNDKASFQMQWNAGKADKVMFCWWKAESPEAIVETLGDMAQLFDNDIREMPNIYDFKD